MPELPEIILLIIHSTGEIGVDYHAIRWRDLPDDHLRAAIERILTDSTPATFGDLEVMGRVILHNRGMFLNVIFHNHPELKLELPQTIGAIVELIHP